MKKINIVYITYDPWWDVDINILRSLKEIAPVKLILVLPNKKNKKYNGEEFSEIPTYKIISKYKNLHPKKWIETYKVVSLIRKISNKETIFIRANKVANCFLDIGMSLFLPANRTITFIHNYQSHSDHKGMSSRNNIFYRRLKYFQFFSKSQYDLFCKDHPQKRALCTELGIMSFGEPQHKLHLKEEGMKTFLFFGNIRKYKRIELFLKAAKHFDGKANFVVAGRFSKDDLNYYKDFVKDCKTVTLYPGFVDHNDVADYFTQSNFLILPYSGSTQAGPAMIAYAYNLPMITSCLPYFTNLIDDGQNGFIFDNEKQLYHIINQCIAMDENALALMKKKQEEYKKNYILGLKIKEKYQAYLEEIISKL